MYYRRFTVNDFSKEIGCRVNDIHVYLKWMCKPSESRIQHTIEILKCNISDLMGESYDQ